LDHEIEGGVGTVGAFVVVAKMLGGFAAGDAEGEPADDGGGWGHADQTAMIHGWMVKSITPGSVVS
jgi:hypothetical protein